MTQAMTQSSHYLLLARLDNASAIGETYGDHVVNFAMDHLQLCLERHLSVLDLRRMGCDEIEILVHSTSTEPAFLQSLIDELCAELALDIFYYAGEQIVLAVSTGCAVPHAEDWGIHRLEARSRLAAAAAPADLPGPHSSRDQKLYRDDMALAAMVLTQVSRGEASFARRPVHQLGVAAEVSHFEALLRLHDDRGEQIECQDGVEALERLGLAYYLDRQLLSQALDELEADPLLSLSVGISAQSLSFNLNGLASGWTELLARLRGNRDLARRLIIEIQETAPIASMPDALAFVREMRALGAAISVAGFGSGPTSIRQLLELRPDMVKLDSDGLGAGEQAGANRIVVEHMIELAHAMADRVILDGVEISSPIEIGIAQPVAEPAQYGLRANGVVHNLMAHRSARNAPALERAAC